VQSVGFPSTENQFVSRPIHTVTASANAIERYSSSELDLHNLFPGARTRLAECEIAKNDSIEC
jgi:hypothetical protein